MWNAFVLSSYQKAFINKADSKRNLKPDYDLICKTGKIKIEHVQNFCEKMHKKVNGNLKFSLLKIKFRHLEIKTVMSQKNNLSFNSSFNQGNIVKDKYFKSPVLESLIKENKSIHRANKIITSLINYKVNFTVFKAIQNLSSSTNKADCSKVISNTIISTSNTQNNKINKQPELLPDSIKDLSPLKFDLTLRKKANNHFEDYLQLNSSKRSFNFENQTAGTIISEQQQVPDDQKNAIDQIHFGLKYKQIKH